jgi:hypothetical protein
MSDQSYEDDEQMLSRLMAEAAPRVGNLSLRLATPIPPRLRTRPKDKRGYPIPWIVFIGADGVPMFTVNDDDRLRACRTKNLCGLCGGRMLREQWFIGAPTCFTHARGAFIDPPNHYECAEYALLVCPYLAAPHYKKLIDMADFPIENTSQIDHPNPANRPEMFGLGATREPGYIKTDHQGGLYVPQRWQYIEYWSLGQRVPAPRHQHRDTRG